MYMKIGNFQPLNIMLGNKGTRISQYESKQSQTRYLYEKPRIEEKNSLYDERIQWLCFQLVLYHNEDPTIYIVYVKP